MAPLSGRMSSNDTPRYFEDWTVGETATAGSYTVTTAEIREFAERYDPQPYHLGEGPAADTIFGELVASGWQTASICMRLFVDEVLSDVAVAGGRGVDELRWYRPVVPGDELSIEAELAEKRPAEDLPGLGSLHTDVEGYTDDGDLAVSFTLRGLVEQRPAD